jgi:hypothetical protein
MRRLLRGLLLVVLGVLGGIVTFFVHSARRSSEIAKRQSSEPKP